MATTTLSPYFRAVVEKVLNAEESDPRFEAASNALIAALEGGAPISKTAASWDLGRDGVGLGLARGLYVLSSLRDDIDAKVLSDLERITSTTRGIKRLYFCLSNRLSEHSREKYEAQLTAESDDAFPIVCYGSLQLSEIAVQHPEVIERFYSAEIADVLKLMTDEPMESSELQGLRLALISTGDDTSDAIRREVYRTGLMDVFRDSQPRTLTKTCKDLSDALRLHRTISEQAVEPHLNDLVRDGLIAVARPAYVMSPAGHEAVAARREAGVDNLLALRGAVRGALEASLGAKMVNDDFARVWTVFEERMAHYFTMRGQSVVAEVCELLGGELAEIKGNAEIPRLSFLDEMAEAVGRTSSHAGRREELAQAVKDLFTDRTGPAANWLVRLATNFMTACALGLEHSSAVAVERLMARTRLVLDTDVVLSLLGEGEPEHDGVVALVERWKRMGGSVLVGEPVLEEVARHAYIAPHDFEQVRRFLPGSPEDRLHMIGNAFVRSFAELMANEKATVRDWREYMRMFAGTSEYDWKRVLETISADYSIRKLPNPPLSSEKFQRDVQNFFVRQVELEIGKDDPYKADKARRDAQLYVALIAHLENIREQDPGASCLLVSSTKRLLSAEAQFRASGEAHLVVTVSAVLYLLSMLPNVTLGLTAMKSFLFDERRTAFSGEFERTVLRLVRGSVERSMPFAKRGTLMRSLRDRILQGAYQQGERAEKAKASARKYEHEAFTESNQARTLEMLSQSLDEIGVDNRAERQISDLKRQVAQLQSQLERQKR